MKFMKVTCHRVLRKQERGRKSKNHKEEEAKAISNQGQKNQDQCNLMRILEGHGWEIKIQGINTLQIGVEARVEGEGEEGEEGEEGLETGADDM